MLLDRAFARRHSSDSFGAGLAAVATATLLLAALDAIRWPEIFLPPVPLTPICPPAPLWFDLGWSGLVMTRC